MAWMPKRARPSPIGAGVPGARKVAGRGGVRRHCPVKLRVKVDRAALDKVPRGHLAGLFCIPRLKPVLATLEGRHNHRPCGAEAPRRRGWGGAPAARHCLVLGAALDDAMLEAGVLRG